MADVDLKQIFGLALIPLAAGIGGIFLKNYPTYASVAGHLGDFLWGLMIFVITQYFGTVAGTAYVAHRLASKAGNTN